MVCGVRAPLTSMRATIRPISSAFFHANAACISVSAFFFFQSYSPRLTPRRMSCPISHPDSRHLQRAGQTSAVLFPASSAIRVRLLLQLLRCQAAQNILCRAARKKTDASLTRSTQSTASSLIQPLSTISSIRSSTCAAFHLPFSANGFVATRTTFFSSPHGSDATPVRFSTPA